MFESEVLYERKYPHKSVEEEQAEFERLAKDCPEEIKAYPPPPFSKFCEDMVAKRTLILLPDRILKSKKFIQLAIETGETYEMDTEISRADSHISVTYRFDCGGEMDYLIPILGQADTISFFAGLCGFDITLILDYYTHAEYCGKRLIHPLNLMN